MKKNPYRYKQPKKKKGEKEFYQALWKILEKDKQDEEDKS